jgi:hypothetical protein
MKIKYILLSAAALCILIFIASGCNPSSTPIVETQTPTTEAGAAGLPQMGSYRPESACDNPYYPRRAGTKTQTGTDGSVITATTSISGDAINVTATVTTTSPDGVDVKKYKCSSNGIVWTEWNLYNADNQVMSTLSYSGVFFPSVEQFNIGAKWEYSIITHKDLDSGWVESETKRNCTVAGTSSVQYQGQFVDALRVDCVNAVKDLKSSDEAALENYYDLYSFFYVYGVGVVGYRASE